MTAVACFFAFVGLLAACWGLFAAITGPYNGNGADEAECLAIQEAAIERGRNGGAPLTGYEAAPCEHHPWMRRGFGVLMVILGVYFVVVFAALGAWWLTLKIASRLAFDRVSQVGRAIQRLQPASPEWDTEVVTPLLRPRMLNTGGP